jgi:hypothetical protein
LSASLDEDKEQWNFRLTAQRLVVLKTVAANVQKAAVLDVFTNRSFAINLPDSFAVETLQVDKQYLASLKVYTSNDLRGVDSEFIDFFGALDVDQSIEDFIKAYWVYPGKICFELVEVDEA